MAVTRLSDAIVPSVFDPYMRVDTAEKAGVFQSGLVVPVADLTSKLAGGGKTFDTPAWDDLDDTTGSGVGSDDPSVLSTPDKLGSLQMTSRRMYRTKSWSSMDLVSELAGSDPMQRIRERVGAWWARDFDVQTVQVLNGMVAANIAQNSGDMVYSAGVGAGGATPTAVLSAEVILEAKQTMGDAASPLSILVMHSRLVTNLTKLDLIDFIPDSQGKNTVKTYLGYRIVETDRVPVTFSSPNYTYYTYLAAPGIIGWGESAPDMPVEVDRTPAAGNGTGQETLYTRRQFTLHPLGHRWMESSVAGLFPTNAELATAANWNRKFPERKQVPFVAIKSLNG